jgi:hypothetical protein
VQRGRDLDGPVLALVHGSRTNLWGAFIAIVGVTSEFFASP